MSICLPNGDLGNSQIDINPQPPDSVSDENMSLTSDLISQDDSFSSFSVHPSNIEEFIEKFVSELIERMCSLIIKENLSKRLAAELHRSNKSSDVSRYTENLFRSEGEFEFYIEEDEDEDEIIINNISLDGTELDSSFRYLHRSIKSSDVSKATENLYRIGMVIDSSEDEKYDEDDVNEVILRNIIISPDTTPPWLATSELPMKHAGFKVDDSISAEPGCSKWDGKRPASEFTLPRTSSARKIFDRIFRRGRTQSMPFNAKRGEPSEEKKTETKIKPKRKLFRRKKETSQNKEDTEQLTKETQGVPEGHNFKFDDKSLSKKRNPFSFFKKHKQGSKEKNLSETLQAEDHTYQRTDIVTTL